MENKKTAAKKTATKRVRTKELKDKIAELEAENKRLEEQLQWYVSN